MLRHEKFDDDFFLSLFFGGVGGDGPVNGGMGWGRGVWDFFWGGGGERVSHSSTCAGGSRTGIAKGVTINRSLVWRGRGPVFRESWRDPPSVVVVLGGGLRERIQRRPHCQTSPREESRGLLPPYFLLGGGAECAVGTRRVYWTSSRVLGLQTQAWSMFRMMSFPTNNNPWPKRLFHPSRLRSCTSRSNARPHMLLLGR